MKIMHASGEDYDLTPGLTLEIERTNPFFNDYGEQSLPVTLPATAKNRRLLSYPDDLRGLSKASQRADAMIQHGAYFMRCRQAILSGNKKNGIETSFYLNTGAFYEKYQDVSLSTIFKDKIISFNSVSEAISFCRGLLSNYDARFACFPVFLEDQILNQLKGNTSSTPDFQRSEATTIESDEKTIHLDPGYYITPFIRANHLLKEVFTYFGYTLLDNFFTNTEPFRSMVFINNTIDTLMKGEIRYVQIVPDCMVSTLLDVYRNLFCCEFIPDEVNKTITIRRFNDVLAEDATTDITRYYSGVYTVEHPSKFKQLKLSATYINTPKTFVRERVYSSDISDSETEVEKFNNLRELIIKYPEAEYDEKTGAFVRKGFRGVQEVSQVVGFITCDYYAGGSLEVFEKKADCTIPTTLFGKRYSGRTTQDYLSVYIGAGRALNSTVVMDSDLPSDDSEEAEYTDDAKTEELPIMPCFAVRHSSGFYDQGTIMNYNDTGVRLFDFILAANGPDGFFERFWRNYDNLLRNSFLKVSIPLLLPEKEKLQLSEYRKVLFDGQELFPNVIRFVANKVEPGECDFYTSKLYTPLSTATLEADIIPKKSAYKWVLKYTRNSPDPNKLRISFPSEPAVSFYKAPTAMQYYQGGRFYEKTLDVIFYSRNSSSGPTDPVDGTITLWLEPDLV